jgi:uncharacterized OB-fold protein
MDQFGATGQFLSYDPSMVSEPVAVVFTLQCRSCGFEPEATVVPPRTCPKCHSRGWERFPKPGSILTNADRY